MSDVDTSPVSTSWPQLDDPEKLERIIDIIAEEGNVDREKVTPDATLESLGLESMDVVMILMGIEEKLETYIPMDADMASARNLAEFIAAVDKAMKSDKSETASEQS
jgi:acyl carrier protein